MMLFMKKYMYIFYSRFNLSKVAKIDLRTLEFQVFRNSVSIQTSYYSKDKFNDMINANVKENY